MSVHPYKTADGTRYQVRWREGNGRVRTRSLPSKREALAFDADVKARKYKGDTLPTSGRETLASAFDEWWRMRATTLASTTQRTYRDVWNAHVRGRFDHHRLSEIVADPQLLDLFSAEMREDGVGNAAQRKVLVVLSAVFTAAVDWKRVATNPVLPMRKPPSTRARYPRPFPPLVVERIRLRMMRRSTMDADGVRPFADSCLVSLMSYCGLRPGEALALTWADVHNKAVIVDKAVSDGKVSSTKTGAVRSVPLPRPVSRDLSQLMRKQIPSEMRKNDGQLTSDDPSRRLLFPASDGDVWSPSEFNNWRKRVWKPVVVALAKAEPRLASIASTRPYDCRGSFVSMHLLAGANPIEIAQWAGHSPAVLFRHYAGIIEEMKGLLVNAVDDQIEGARETVAARSAEELDQLAADLYRGTTRFKSGSTERAAYQPIRIGETAPPSVGP